MEQKLRIGMIGCGEIAYKSTGKAIAAASNAEMVIAMDTVAEVAQSFGETYGIPSTTNADEVFAHSEVDAVVISAPHFLHEPLTIAAAKAGKHVLCEKPIACTLDEADRMIAACKEAGVLLSINLFTRFSKATQRAKELFLQGVVGRVIGMQFHVMANKPDSYWTGGYTGRVQTDWRMSREKSGGGVLLMNLIHDFDRFRHITGLEAIRASAEFATFCTNTEVEDYISVVYRYDNDAIGSATAASCARGGVSHGNRITGTEGQILFEPNLLKVYTQNESCGIPTGAWQSIEVPDEENPVQLYIERFAKAVANGQQPDIPGEEGRKSLELVLAAYQAGTENRSVSLPL